MDFIDRKSKILSIILLSIMALANQTKEKLEE